jgi:DNA helicase HerA-like ATPase
MDDLMSQKPQTYSNHARRQLVFHFFLVPVLILNLLYSVILLIRHPNPNAVWVVIMAIALLVMAFLVRINPIKVQDRLIRLEERLRLSNLLSEPLRSRIPELTERQLVALRFASDEEIPALVEETLAHHLKGKEIKQRIKNWRPDHWRV